MAMKIRNRFLLSIMMVILSVLASAVFMMSSGMLRLQERSLALTVKSMDSLTTKNIDISRKVLTKAGERYVEMNSATAATQLRFMLNTFKKPFDYAVLRSNPEIRKIATREIRGFGKKASVVGHMDMLDTNGDAVIHSNPSIEGENYIKWEKKFPSMWELVKRSFRENKVNGYYTFLDKNNNPVKKYMSLTRVKDTPFIICAVVEISEFFLPVHKIIKHIESDEKKRANMELKTVSARIMNKISRASMITAAVLFLFGALLALWQSATLAKPIKELSKQAQLIGDGDFSAKVAEKGAMEMRLLARSFNNLGTELTEYIENLKMETAHREAIESEIKVARGIQEALIPSVFPPFPDKREFDLFASLTPAKEVSGDFYDFFMISDQTVALVIADVSGKGLPAAIFMAVTRTLIRNLCMNSNEKVSPSEIMRKANQYLCVDNDACMFVTTFIAYYNFKTGEFSYANAGHNPFIILRKNEKPKSLGVLADYPLGIVPKHKFSKGEWQLAPGEAILVYTDGITEATAPDGSMFGELRLLDFLEKSTNASPKEIVESLVEDVLKFQNNERFDDVTVLMLKRS